jgi:hypothetical protein
MTSSSKKHKRNGRDEKISPEEVAKKVKDVAKTIRETSSAARDTVKKIHGSGAITELAEAVQEAAVATKDTANEISDAAKEIRYSHVAEGTASAMEETARTVGETLEVTKDTARQGPMAAPKTPKTVRKGAVKVGKATKATFYQATNRLKGAVKTKGKAKDIKKKSKTRLAKQKRAVRRMTE